MKVSFLAKCYIYDYQKINVHPSGELFILTPAPPAGSHWFSETNECSAAKLYSLLHSSQDDLSNDFGNLWTFNLAPSSCQN